MFSPRKGKPLIWVNLIRYYTKPVDDHQQFRGVSVIQYILLSKMESKLALTAAASIDERPFFVDYK